MTLLSVLSHVCCSPCSYSLWHYGDMTVTSQNGHPWEGAGTNAGPPMWLTQLAGVWL